MRYSFEKSHVIHKSSFWPPELISAGAVRPIASGLSLHPAQGLRHVADRGNASSAVWNRLDIDDGAKARPRRHLAEVGLLNEGDGQKGVKVEATFSAFANPEETERFFETAPQPTNETLPWSCLLPKILDGGRAEFGRHRQRDRNSPRLSWYLLPDFGCAGASARNAAPPTAASNATPATTDEEDAIVRAGL